MAEEDKKEDFQLFNSLIRSGDLWTASTGNMQIFSQEERSPLDEVLSLLACRQVAGKEIYGGIHEWLMPSSSSQPHPTTLLTGIVEHAVRASWAEEQEWRRLIVWIGEEIQPSPFLLASTLERVTPTWQTRLLPSCIFLIPNNKKEHFWMLKSSLASPAVLAVVSDIPPLTFQQTLRLARAAERGNTIGLFSRCNKKRTQPSAAATRWLVQPYISSYDTPQWLLHLLHTKGQQPLYREWIVEGHHDEKISLHISEGVVNQSHSEERWRQAIA